jgi:hypothetical protein
LTDARIGAGSSSSTLLSKSLDSRTIPANLASEGEFSMAWLKVTDLDGRWGEYMAEKALLEGVRVARLKNALIIRHSRQAAAKTLAQDCILEGLRRRGKIRGLRTVAQTAGVISQVVINKGFGRLNSCWCW